MSTFSDFSNPNSVLDSVSKFGENPDIDTGTVPEDVWDVGGLYPFPSSALETTIVSTSADDTSTGTGARTVTVFGLSDDFSLLQETITLNGTTPITLSDNYYRVYRVKVVTVGSNASNVGDIDVKHGSTVLARILAGENQTLMAIFTIPNTYHVAYITSVSGQTLKNNAIISTFELQIREDNGNAFTPVVRFSSVAGAKVQLQPPAPIAVLRAGADIRLRCVETSANNANVGGTFTVDMYVKPRGTG